MGKIGMRVSNVQPVLRVSGGIVLEIGTDWFINTEGKIEHCWIIPLAFISKHFY